MSIDKYLSKYIRTLDKCGLDRMSGLLSALGNPHLGLRYVHVAGTNGKGSTCRLLAEVLTQQGYKTALFTSPHIHKYNDYLSLFLINLTGFPAQISKGGTSFVTTDEAPTIAPSPIVTGLHIIVFAPM